MMLAISRTINRRSFIIILHLTGALCGLVAVMGLARRRSSAMLSRQHWDSAALFIIAYDEQYLLS